jgi:hypothetical protein
MHDANPLHACHQLSLAMTIYRGRAVEDAVVQGIFGSGN